MKTLHSNDSIAWTPALALCCFHAELRSAEDNMAIVCDRHRSSKICPGSAQESELPSSSLELYWADSGCVPGPFAFKVYSIFLNAKKGPCSEPTGFKWFNESFSSSSWEVGLGQCQKLSISYRKCLRLTHRSDSARIWMCKTDCQSAPLGLFLAGNESVHR